MKASVAALCMGACAVACAGESTITMFDIGSGHPVPKTLYGVFFEDINHAADGGIYPELLANRGFDWKTKDLEGWEADFRGGAMARISLQDGRPVDPNTAWHLRIECFGAGDGCGVVNKDYDGVSVEAGKEYELTFYARGLDGYGGGLRAVLEDGGTQVCSAKLDNGGMMVGGKSGGPDPVLPQWKKHRFVFRPDRTVVAGTFSILMDSPGTVELEQVSLYPRDTYGARRNGLRKDLVEMLKAMRPGVLRFPGGCIAEGHDFQHWYDWKRTVGPLERRETIWNTWGYWQSMGLGYYEYFCLAEDIGAEPLPICLAGMTCQFRGPKFAPVESMPYFAENICDLIDFANGDPASSKWAKVRADMGHPAPFGLKYVGIGNENWGAEFLERFKAIGKIVRERHPEIRIVSTVGAAPAGADFDLAWRELNDRNADVADEHFYMGPRWFLDSASRYDGYSRTGKPKVYAGEYACHVESRRNNLESALCEAAVMTGFERNSDVVEMTSYAPLFQKIGWNGWKPDLIWFDNLRCFGTPNYYVQKMFGANRPTRYVPSVCVPDSSPREMRGAIVFGTWNTVAEFKDVRVAAPDGRTLYEGAPDPARCARGPNSAWTLRDGVLRQENRYLTYDSWLRFGDESWGDVVFSFKARRCAGDEGFMAKICSLDGSEITFNFGGWGNTRSTVEGRDFNFEGETSSSFTARDRVWHEVEIRLQGGVLSASVDGVKCYSDVKVSPKKVKSLYHVCGYDEDAREFVVKCVNLEQSGERTLAVDFGVNVPACKARMEVLSGSPDDENDMEHPVKCATRRGSVAVEGGRVARFPLKPYSLTVLRIPYPARNP